MLTPFQLLNQSMDSNEMGVNIMPLNANPTFVLFNYLPSVIPTSEMETPLNVGS
jgi:hypothetical protein